MLPYYNPIMNQPDLKKAGGTIYVGNGAGTNPYGSSAEGWKRRKYNELLSKTSPKVKLAYETPDGMVIYEHTYARKAGQPWNRGIAL